MMFSDGDWDLKNLIPRRNFFCCRTMLPAYWIMSFTFCTRHFWFNVLIFGKKNNKGPDDCKHETENIERYLFKKSFLPEVEKAYCKRQGCVREPVNWTND